MQVYRVIANNGLWMKYNKDNKEVSWVKNKEDASWYRRAVPEIVEWILQAEKLPKDATDCQLSLQNEPAPKTEPGD